MNISKTNQRNLAAYGAGSGNAPALVMFDSVGHLQAAFLFKLLKIKRYEQFKCLC